MKQIELIATASNFSAANIGKLSELNDYVLQLGPDVKIPGKVFGGAAIGATGGDFSFQVFQPGTETGFLHTHKKHEELYFFLSGQGEFQVDGQVISVGEGSVGRVPPAAPLVVLCVQYRGATFTEEDAADGVILNEAVTW